MSNSNPSPQSRFQPGVNNHGCTKQKGARDRLSAAFLSALADDFDAHGPAVIRDVRANDAGTYLRIVASLLPKEVELNKRPLASLSDDELLAAIDAVKEVIRLQSLEEPAAAAAAKKPH